MPTAKDIHVAPISSQDANRIVKKYHYSGKVVNNSTLHFGVFLNGVCEGVMSFGNSLDKRKVQELVKDTRWNDFLELNRMAFSDRLPRNSESRALSIAFKLIKKHYPHIEWIISFSDGTQCGDGTIYRASGFVLTQIKINKTILEFPNGERVSDMGLKFSKETQIRLLGGVYLATECLKKARQNGANPLSGFQLRYIYFLNPAAKSRLTVPILPFSKIDEMGAGMYKGNKRVKPSSEAIGDQPIEGVAESTHTLQS